MPLIKDRLKMCAYHCVVQIELTNQVHRWRRYAKSEYLNIQKYKSMTIVADVNFPSQKQPLPLST